MELEVLNLNLNPTQSIHLELRVVNQSHVLRFQNMSASSQTSAMARKPRRDNLPTANHFKYFLQNTMRSCYHGDEFLNEYDKCMNQHLFWEVISLVVTMVNRVDHVLCFNIK